jgi:hypothetical protein
MPAKAGIQDAHTLWTPAFAGMTRSPATFRSHLTVFAAVCAAGAWNCGIGSPSFFAK